MKTSAPPPDIPIVERVGPSPEERESLPRQTPTPTPVRETPTPEPTEELLSPTSIPQYEPTPAATPYPPYEPTEPSAPDRFAETPPPLPSKPETSPYPVRDLAAQIAGEDLSPQQPEEALPGAEGEEAIFPEGEAPLKPEELLALEEEVAEYPRERRFPLHFPGLPGIPRGLPPPAFAAGGGVFLVILLLGTYLLFFRNGAPDVEPPPSVSPTSPVDIPVTPPPPEAVIPITSSTTLPISDPAATSLEVAELLAGTTTPNTLRAVSLKLEADGSERYLGFDETVEALGVSFPEDVAAVLDTSRFTFFVFGQPGTAETRAGLAIAIRDADTLRAAMANWEPRMPDDLDPLLRKLGETGAPSSPSFRTTVRKNLTNRYMNFPDPTISLDYAIDPNNYILLLSTSQSAQYTAIDLLP